ncbi:MAG: hypothetical protein WA821_02350, partial [Anaerolineales bacterium]
MVGKIASWFSPDTYQFNKPFHTPAARGLLLLALLMLAFALVAQGIGLSSLSASLPPPALDTRHPEVNAKLTYLEAFA